MKHNVCGDPTLIGKELFCHTVIQHDMTHVQHML